MKHALSVDAVRRISPAVMMMTEASLVRGGDQRVLRIGDTLFREGDERRRVFVVESGWLKLTRTLCDGQRQIVGFPTRGSIIGLEAPHDYRNECVALTASAVHSFPISALVQLCRNPRFSESLLRQLGVQLGDAQTQLASVGAQSAAQKTAVFLTSIADSNADATSEFTLPMRRGDIGEFLGLRLETVSRMFGAFRERGWIAMPAIYRCRITNSRALATLASGAGGMKSMPPKSAAMGRVGA
jgi:CRP-like cAMP-binding protein